jgi:integrase
MLDVRKVSVSIQKSTEFARINDVIKRRYLTEEECRRVIEIPQPRTRTGLRNATIIRILVEGGLKVSELVGRESDVPDVSTDRGTGGIRIGDILWDENAIIVRRTGERQVPLSSETMRFLREWVLVRPSSNTLLVFTTLQGKKLKNRYVRQFISRYGREAGIAVPVKPSVLRNSFAQRVQEAGGDIGAVRNRLGLSDTTTPPPLEA